TSGQTAFRRVEVTSRRGPTFNSGINAILEDRRGSLWVGMNGELYRLLPNSKTENYTARHGLHTAGIWSLLEDRDGRIWVGAVRGLFLLAPEPELNKSIVARRYTITDGLASNTVFALRQAADGRIWIGTAEGLTEFDGARMRSYTRAHGLSERGVNMIVEDRDGNLWMGTYGSGVMKLIRNGFTSYGEADSSGLTQIYSILEDDNGELFTIGEGWRISHFDKGMFVSARPKIPQDLHNTWMPQLAFLDHTGEWWMASNQGLYRFPRLSRIERLAYILPSAIYTSHHGLPEGSVHRFFEDSHGDLWMGTSGSARNRLVRWERKTGVFHQYSESDGLPPSNMPFAFCEDRASNLWIGFYDGGVARYRRGRFELFTGSGGSPTGVGWPTGVGRPTGAGWPTGVITKIFLDRSGRLWIASSQSGISRIDDPTADRPKPINYTTAEGLSSNDTRCFTEDQWGRIYIGTVRGVDQLNPSTDQITHYTTADGLSNDFVISALRDRRGWLWFGTWKGLSRLIPEPDRPVSSPPVLITGLRVAGYAYSVSELGQTEVRGLELESSQNQVQIDFTGLAFALGESLRFRYKLEDADSYWSPLTSQRTVNYASLRPGSYRFVVQAVNQDGRLSPTPAVVAFRIRPPLWQRWWFIALTAALIGSGFYALYRYRLGRLIEMERVRTRIAADLHDDIGSSLSQIAIISEVLHKQIQPQEQSVDRNLSMMARVSREAVDSMSDIVWAINPQRDHMHDLVRRMRRFASETFPARNIDFSFQVPTAEQDIKLDADVRRQVFLIFKEGVNNIVRHSGCVRAEIEMRIEGPWLVLKIADNGQGIDDARFNEGNGLVSIRRRAESLGGSLDVISDDGGGTTIALKVLHGHRAGVLNARW
ncbi:MAG TPA: two-component regulator propeller domain-containing protein, partial [Blastocatellia bacterium]|nr:two-component regulator propeller domain-containing protein [Blastocatellia bacterium]